MPTDAESNPRHTGSPQSPSGRPVMILHGKRSHDRAIRAIIDEVRSEIDFDVRPTFHPGDSARLAEEAIALGRPSIVVAGGDGSINEVVHGMLRTAKTGELPPLGIWPLGTANDLAFGLGIPADNLALSLRLAFTGEPAMVDVGRVADRVFVNVATTGFGAEVTADTNEGLKSLIGSAAYFVTGFSKLAARERSRVRLRWPDNEWVGEFLLLCVGNGTHCGGGVAACAGAKIDDGLLNATVIEAPEDGAVLKTLLEGLSNGLERVPELGVTHVAPWFEIESDEATLQVNIDGEPIRASALRFELLNKALPLRVPAHCPLLAAPF